MPEPSRAVVAVGKGMDELELVVEDARDEERVQVSCGEPPKEVRHDLRDIVRPRAGMDERLPIKDPDVIGAEAAGMLDEPVHHDAMGVKEVVQAQRVEGVDELIGPLRVIDLEDVPCGPEDAPAVHDGGHGLLGERVSLDHERRADGADAQLAVEGRTCAKVRGRMQHAHELCDLHAEVVNLRRSLKGRLVSHATSYYRHYFTANGGKTERGPPGVRTVSAPGPDNLRKVWLRTGPRIATSTEAGPAAPREGVP